MTGRVLTMEKISPVMELPKWRDELIGIVREIADPVELRGLWLGEYKDRISSYEEIVADFFGTYQIDQFFAHFVNRIGLTQAQADLLRRFSSAFSECRLHIQEISSATRSQHSPLRSKVDRDHVSSKIIY